MVYLNLLQSVHQIALNVLRKSSICSLLSGAAWQFDINQSLAVSSNSSRTALAVVLASAGYPESPKLNDEIHIEDRIIPDSYIFHAGTIYKDNKLLTSGGRVLAVTALGNSLKEAQIQAYEAISTVKFTGAQYRQDIGYRALNNN